MPETTQWIHALRSSHDRFVDLTGALSATEVEQQSYADEWSIAQTASHLGSQAEIFGLFLAAGLDGSPAPGGEVFGPIWDRWNALAPIEQVRASTEANERFVTRLEQSSAEERESFSLLMFGNQLDLAGLAGMRLGEHALHTWDVAVALDPAALVSPDAVELLVDQLPQTAARAGKPVEGTDPVPVTTTGPARSFVLTAAPEVTLQPTPDGAATGAALTLPAEALVRLVYGRLDPEHTPASAVDDDRLPALRKVFPGF